MEGLMAYSMFRGISEAECSKILTCLRAKVRWYSEGTRIYPIWDEADQVCILTQGTAEVLRAGPYGQEIKLETLRPGGMFGLESAFGGFQLENVEVRATTQCQILYLHREQIIKRCAHACECHSRLVANFLRIMALRTADLSRRIEVLSCRTTREKVLAYLEQEAARQEMRRFQLPIAQKEMAELLGVDRSAMWRELKAMRRDGILDFKGRTFELLY